MNYRHIYHAGNFADVFKHIILVLCLEKMQEKSSPFFVLDTHAGIGKYDLLDQRCIKTGEAEVGIKKLLQLGCKLPPKYLAILAKTNCCEISELSSKLRFYTGSPLIIKNFLRPQDRAILGELNHEEFVQLKRNFAGNKKFSLMREDGFNLLKSKLPPIERRGLILIDPPFEKDQSLVSKDYSRIIEAMKEAQKRFANGVYLIWYPIIEGEESMLERFGNELKKIDFPKIDQFTFSSKDKEGQKMSSCGVSVVNAPWQLEEKLQPFLSNIKNLI